MGFFSSCHLTVFKKDLDKDVADDTSGNFAKLLLALVQVCVFHCLLFNSCEYTLITDLPYLHADQTSRTVHCCGLREDRSRCQSKLPVFSSLLNVKIIHFTFYLIVSVVDSNNSQTYFTSHLHLYWTESLKRTFLNYLFINLIIKLIWFKIWQYNFQTRSSGAKDNPIVYPWLWKHLCEGGGST